jgi:hypothetical protein
MEMEMRGRDPESYRRRVMELWENGAAEHDPERAIQLRANLQQIGALRQRQLEEDRNERFERDRQAEEDERARRAVEQDRIIQRFDETNPPPIPAEWWRLPQQQMQNLTAGLTPDRQALLEQVRQNRLRIDREMMGGEFDDYDYLRHTGQIADPPWQRPAYRTEPRDRWRVLIGREEIGGALYVRALREADEQRRIAQERIMGPPRLVTTFQNNAERPRPVWHPPRRQQPWFFTHQRAVEGPELQPIRVPQRRQNENIEIGPEYVNQTQINTFGRQRRSGPPSPRNRPPVVSEGVPAPELPASLRPPTSEYLRYTGSVLTEGRPNPTTLVPPTPTTWVPPSPPPPPRE